MDIEEGVVRTTSHLRKWYLTTFGGLKVRAVRMTPLTSIMGAMVYSRCWVLVANASLPDSLGQL